MPLKLHILFSNCFLDYFRFFWFVLDCLTQYLCKWVVQCSATYFQICLVCSLKENGFLVCIPQALNVEALQGLGYPGTHSIKDKFVESSQTFVYIVMYICIYIVSNKTCRVVFPYKVTRCYQIIISNHKYLCH